MLTGDLFWGRSCPEISRPKTTVIFDFFSENFYAQHCIVNYLKLLLMIKQNFLSKSMFFLPFIKRKFKISWIRLLQKNIPSG